MMTAGDEAATRTPTTDSFESSEADDLSKKPTHSLPDIDDFHKPAEDKEAEEPIYEQSSFEKWINILLCRGDLASERFEAPPVAFTDLFRYGSRHDKMLVIAGILLAILSGAAQPFPMYLQGKIANVLITHGSGVGNDELWSTGYSIVAVNATLGVVMIVATFLQYFCLRAACRNITTTLRSRFIASVLRQDAGWFDTQKFGTINSQLNENINLISDGIAEKIGLLVRGLSSFLTTLTFSFLVNWKLSASIIAVGPISCLLMSFMARLIARSNRLQLPYLERASALLQEIIMNVRTVQSCNGQHEMIDKYSRTLKAGRTDGILAYVWNGLFDGIFFLALYAFFGLGLFYGGMEYYYDRIAPGDVLIVTTSILLGTYFLGVMSPHIMSILKARVAAALIYQRIERVPTIDCYSEEGAKIGRPKGHIEFRDVHFAYPNRKNRPILKGVTWEAEPGEIVALVGHSGCGKSTSMGLLTRLYEATGGSVCVDGMDVRSLNIKSLRRQIGIVQQEPVLFGGTIFENIALGDVDIDQQRVERACRMANAHDFIEKLEKGYHTIIGSGGVQLSGGQKQRIAIARAIVNDPPILLLDEATSALDAESEIHVQTALRDASRGRTTLVIAHRLSTLRDVKKIVVLEEGIVVEVGTHEELARKPEGLYAALVKAQQFQQTVKKEEPQNEIEEFAPSVRSGTLHSSVRSSMLGTSRQLAIAVGADAGEQKEVGFMDSLTSGGLFRLYAKCSTHAWQMIAGTVFAMIRGCEMPLYVLLMYYGFIIFQEKDVELAVYQSRIMWLALSSLFIGFFCVITIFASNAFYGWGTELNTDELKVRALRNVLRQDAAYFDRPETANAKLIQRINTAGAAVKAAMDIRLYHVVNNVTCMFGMTTLSLLFSWEVGLTGLGLYAALITLLAVMARGMRSGMMKMLEIDDSAKLAVEIIENTRTIQLLTRENYFLEKFVGRLKNCHPVERRVAIYDSVIFAFTQSFMYLSDMACYSVGLYLVYYGMREPSQIFSSCQFMAALSWAFLFVSLSFNEILHAIPASDSICEIVDAVPAVDDHEEDGVDGDIFGDVFVQKVIFAYPSRPQQNVANGLVVRANRGETVALVGPSGCGKSTIISLLQRFYEPKSGQLTVDAMPIPKYKLSALRRQMALVGQEPVLFSGSIYENICLGVSGATREDVVEACRLANAARFIERLPDGYETEVGEKGAQLSGGQKQRIAIARALIRKPKILLLDEATSALDAESERAVQLALDSASEGRTCITIAHRLSSIQHADRIYFISNGRVVECGDHQRLMADNGPYAEMIRKQDLSLEG